MKSVENEKNHIIPYKTFLYVLAVLIALTLTSVTLTQIYLGALTVTIALLIAAIKSSFVLRIFMHLKFENKMFSRAVIGVIMLLCAVITVTLLDYLNR
ncbi:MAG: cytochrome C oxidase subunit IV family protein [Bacteroidales bacterium]